jgi:hypothetical protein
MSERHGWLRLEAIEPRGFEPFFHSPLETALKRTVVFPIDGRPLAVLRLNIFRAGG